MLEALLRTDDKLLLALPGCLPGVSDGRFAYIITNANVKKVKYYS